MTISVQQILDLPDMNWQDSGRKVKFTKDGAEQIGVLFCNDFFFDGEDEQPMFVIELEDESNLNIFDVVWEYVE